MMQIEYLKPFKRRRVAQEFRFSLLFSNLKVFYMDHQPFSANAKSSQVNHSYK